MREHVYIGGRCIYCHVNDNDQAIYGATECIEREPLVYTTETGDDPHEVQDWDWSNPR